MSVYKTTSEVWYKKFHSRVRQNLFSLYSLSRITISRKASCNLMGSMFSITSNNFKLCGMAKSTCSSKMPCTAISTTSETSISGILDLKINSEKVKVFWSKKFQLPWTHVVIDFLPCFHVSWHDTGDLNKIIEFFYSQKFIQSQSESIDAMLGRSIDNILIIGIHWGTRRNRHNMSTLSFNHVGDESFGHLEFIVW